MQDYPDYIYYRGIRTTQERRANGTRHDRFEESHNKYVRAKRRKLPNAWDDFYVRKQKSWKKRRKTQYREVSRSRLKENRRVFSEAEWKECWELKDYLKEHKIPFRYTEHKINIVREYKITRKSVLSGYRPNYGYSYWRSDYTCYTGIQRGWIPVYKDVELDKPIIRRYKYSVTTGYEIVWWTNKNIGV